MILLVKSYRKIVNYIKVGKNYYERACKGNNNMVNCNKNKYNFEDLLDIMSTLRAPGGCPWDGEQTHQTIRRNFIEEVYEACEAIDLSDDRLLCEELGDVLLQVVFHAKIAQDRNAFDIDDVCDGVCKKLIHRHPHIFGDQKLNTSEQVLEMWDEVKKKEKQQKTTSESIDQIAKTLPALIYAEKVQKKAEKSALFIWQHVCSRSRGRGNLP